jgi:hypothetical protein
MLTIIGGTYLELCQEPTWSELYGSGLRAAAALADNVPDIHFYSCVGKDFLTTAEYNAVAYGFTVAFESIPETVSFSYHHPLAQPLIHPASVLDQPKIQLPAITADTILVYGQVEANIPVVGNYVVYDPQNHVSWRDTGSTAEHLALVLNRNEALLLSGLQEGGDLIKAGMMLLTSEKSEVVIIKNGSQGAWVVERSGAQLIPVFKTNSVWSIGSGDIFSAVFAWKWAVEKLPASAAARLASQYTAQFCQDRVLPLSAQPAELEALQPKPAGQLVYLAGPFFTMAERWLINELRDKLLEFGNRVFSPLHDVGEGPPHQVVAPDIAGIREADVVLAVATGLDAGTIFEIGFARALEKRVVVFAENTTAHDLTMLIGTDCEITNDFTTAVYRTSW